MHFVIDRATLVLEGTHDEIIVPVSLVLDSGLAVPSGAETISDAEATAISRADARRRDGESVLDYEQRVLQLVTWSQEHLLQIVAARRSHLDVELRAIAPLVLVPSPTQETPRNAVEETAVTS